MDQKRRGIYFTEIRELISEKLNIRICRDIPVDYLSGLQLQNEKHIETRETEHINGEKVAANRESQCAFKNVAHERFGLISPFAR